MKKNDIFTLALTRYCHIFIKGCTGEDYTGFFQTAGYIEKNTAPACDSEQDCITDHNYRNIPELPELLEEFLPWIQEVQKECHSTRFMAKRSNEQPLPKMAQKQ
mgnify:FL=1